MSFIIGMTPRDTQPISVEVYNERLAEILKRHPKSTSPTEDPKTRKEYADVFVIPGGILSATEWDYFEAGVVAYADFSGESSKEGYMQRLLSLAAIADRLSADLYWYLDKIEPGREEMIVDDYLKRCNIRPSRMGCGNGSHD